MSRWPALGGGGSVKGYQALNWLFAFRATGHTVIFCPTGDVSASLVCGTKYESASSALIASSPVALVLVCLEK
jgi:hypothetical protein